jgi:glycosyltransferase involved in cell wall biosynthesis
MPPGPVLLVGPVPPPVHGVAVMTEALCSSLRGNGITYVLVDTADRRGLANIGMLDWQNVALAIRHGVEFVWLLCSRRPKLVYVPIAQSAPGFLRDCLFLLPSRIARRKVVVHLHGSQFGDFYRRANISWRWFIRWVLSDVRYFIVLGESLRSIGCELVPQQRVVVIPNGVDEGHFTSRNQVVATQPLPELSVTYLGTLTRAKGYLDVLMAAPLVRRELPNVRFTVAGELLYADEAEETQRWIASSGIGDITRLTGVLNRTEKAELLATSDVFVFPPRQAEGQPLVILEAMAAGLPVITTNRGAIAETVVDGVNGFIVPAADPEALAASIVLVLQDRELRGRMGRASRDRVLRNYRLRRWGDDMLRLFGETLAEP